MTVLKFIEENPSVGERMVIKVMTKRLKISPRAIRQYISELEYEDEIENRDDRLYPSGYGETDGEKTEGV